MAKIVNTIEPVEKANPAWGSSFRTRGSFACCKPNQPERISSSSTLSAPLSSSGDDSRRAEAEAEPAGQ